MLPCPAGPSSTPAFVPRRTRRLWGRIGGTSETFEEPFDRRPAGRAVSGMPVTLPAQPPRLARERTTRLPPWEAS
eukprot:12069021-Alexandrium_andersonii.AAC.1